MAPYFIRYDPFGFVKDAPPFQIVFDETEPRRFESYNAAFQFVRELCERFKMIPDEFYITPFK